MKKNVLICDNHEDRLAIEKVTLTTMTSGRVSKDVCLECLNEFNMSLPSWMGGKRVVEKGGTKTKRTSQRATRSNAGMTEAITELMTARRGQALTTYDISATLTQYDHHAMAQALAQLTKKGVLERVAKATYRLRESSGAIRAVV